MNDSTDYEKFPFDWDIEDKAQLDYYNKCLPYIKSENGFDNIIHKSKIFYAFGVGAIGYFLILSLMLIKYRNHYIFKRQGRVYFLLFMLGSILISVNSFISQITYKHYPCIVLNLIVTIGYPLTFVSYTLIILTNFKNYYNSQIAYIEMFENFNKKKKEKTNRFLFKYIYRNMPQTKVSPFFVYYLLAKWMLVYFLYFSNDMIQQNGFCKISIIHMPEFIEVFIFLVIFLPLALIEVLKFDDTFKMKKKIINSVLTTILCALGYLTLSLVKRINCSLVVKYVPSDSFVIMLFILSSIYLCIPTLKDISHLNKQKAETKATQNGMLRMLEDNVLLREFSEFCRKENCTENILFYQHYWKFKKLFDNNQERISKMTKINNANYTISNNYLASNAYDYDYHDHGSMMSFETPIEASVCIEEGNATINVAESSCYEESETASKKIHFGIGRKITRNDILLKEAQNIINDFILNDSKFEVNITDKAKRNIIYNLNEIRTNELQQQDFKVRLKSIFDDAYSEVLNSLFLNSYTNYILLKKSTHT